MMSATFVGLTSSLLDESDFFDYLHMSNVRDTLFSTLSLTLTLLLDETSVYQYIPPL
jgi:hypothetical protein